MIFPAFLILSISLFFGGCTMSSLPEEKEDLNLAVSEGSAPSSLEKPLSGPITQLEFDIIKNGQGASAQKGDQVVVHYVGTFLDGRSFDSSRERGEPFSFVIGEGRVISGWEKGVTGMRIGEIRQLKIPYDMAYGEAGRPPLIPPRTPLIFEIELLDIF